MLHAETSERRLGARTQANDVGMMIVGAEESPCVVLDVSSQGARLCVSSVRVPTTFNLRFHGQTHGCAVVWQTDMEIGVSFCDPHEAKADVPAPTPGRKLDMRGLRSKLFGKRS